MRDRTATALTIALEFGAACALLAVCVYGLHP